MNLPKQDFDQDALEGRVVGLRFKQGPPRDAPVQDVVDETGGGDAGTARQAASLHPP